MNLSEKRPKPRGIILAGAVLLCALAATLVRYDAGVDPPAGPAAVHQATAAREPRPSYRHSVVRRGVWSADDVRHAKRTDAVVRAHYRGIDAERLRPVLLNRTLHRYVSYRKGDRVYWTAKRVRIDAGEVVLTDGAASVRARCGNRISDHPEIPVDPGGSGEGELDLIEDEDPDRIAISRPVPRDPIRTVASRTPLDQVAAPAMGAERISAGRLASAWPLGEHTGWPLAGTGILPPSPDRDGPAAPQSAIAPPADLLGWQEPLLPVEVLDASPAAAPAILEHVHSPGRSMPFPPAAITSPRPRPSPGSMPDPKPAPAVPGQLVSPPGPAALQFIPGSPAIPVSPGIRPPHRPEPLDPVQTPEPTTFLLTGVALAAVLVLRRRARQA